MYFWGCKDKGSTCGASRGDPHLELPRPLATKSTGPPSLQGQGLGPMQSSTGTRKMNGNVFGLHPPEDLVCRKERLIIFFNAISSKGHPNNEGGEQVPRAQAGKRYRPA